MNPQPLRDLWTRLTAAARLARAERDERDTAAPYGFATRVAALAFVQEPRGGFALVERFALRALGVACLLAVGSVVLNYADSPVPATNAGATFEEYAAASTPVPTDDAVAIVLDFAD